jgi:hypothetical protein
MQVHENKRYCDGVEVELHTFFPSIHKDERSVSRAGRLTPVPTEEVYGWTARPGHCRESGEGMGGNG